MPNYRTHLVGGICAYALVLSLLVVVKPSYITLIEWFLCALAGSLFPDIDTKSKGQKYFYQIVGIIALGLISVQKYGIVSGMLLIALLPLFVRHRGITHSVYAMTTLCGICAGFSCIYCPLYSQAIAHALLFFWAGIVSHLILDLGVKRTFALQR